MIQGTLEYLYNQLGREFCDEHASVQDEVPVADEFATSYETSDRVSVSGRTRSGPS